MVSFHDAGDDNYDDTANNDNNGEDNVDYNERYSEGRGRRSPNKEKKEKKNVG